MSRISEFLTDIDQRWRPAIVGNVRLRIIGSGALMLRSDYERGTKDGDVLETADLATSVKADLVKLAGKKSEIYARWRIYIDFVSPALPFLPAAPVWHEVGELNAKLRNFSVVALDVVDVVVSKLKRFSSFDQQDIEAMVGLDLVPHDRLIERFRSAVDAYSMDARAEDLPDYVEHLHRIERDQFGLPPTEIELPGWIL